jgi:hypothetical protein
MINKKIASEIGVGVVLLTAIVIGGIFWMQNKNSVISEQSSVIENEKIEQSKPAEKKVTMCTQDAKLCEDGKTYVGRSGENCEFAACPIVDNDWKLISGNPKEDCSALIYEGSGNITGYYSYEDIYGPRWIFRFVSGQENVKLDKSQEYILLVDADKALEDRLKKATMKNPITITVKGLSIHCEGAAASIKSAKESFANNIKK